MAKKQIINIGGVDILPVTDLSCVQGNDTLALKTQLPTNVSDLTNDSNFIDNTVNNLTNYYLKTETFTKDEVNALIANVSTFNALVVENLPTENISTTTIYLVAKGDLEQDIFNEYMYINGKWELIGSTAVDISNLASKTELSAVETKVDANTSDITALKANAIVLKDWDGGEITIE